MRIRLFACLLTLTPTVFGQTAPVVPPPASGADLGILPRAGSARPVIQSPVANTDSCNFLIHSYRVTDASPEASFRHYISGFAEAGFKTVVFCVCSKRTNYKSDAWDYWWKGFDPDKGPGQPFFAGTPKDETDYWYPKVKHYLDFHARGMDYPAAAVRLSRECGISPWLGIRMNDIHNGAQTNHFKHGTFVASNPQFRRKTAKPEYYSYALDYAHAAVRAHVLSLIRELLARYDMDGLELDFMREPYLFSEGEELAGGTILTDWLTREVRPLVDAAAGKAGHPIRLGARVPSDPDTAAALGFEVARWLESGLFDVLVPTPRWETIEFDMPWDKWLRLKKTQAPTVLLAGMENNYRPFVTAQKHPLPRQLLFGAAANALSSGAEGLYTFNFVPQNRRSFLWATSALTSLDSLLSQQRAHAVTYSDIVPRGQKPQGQLPFDGREGAIRLRVAPIAKGDTLTLKLGLHLKDGRFRAPQVTLLGTSLELRDNGKQPPSGLTEALATFTASEPVPAGHLQVRLSWGTQTPVQIRSVELLVTPRLIPPLKAASPTSADGQRYDLVVAGGTPGGIACAVRAAREGLKVLLVNHTGHIGGFMTSGAGGWEAPYDGQRSPLYGEMLSGAERHYREIYGKDSQQHVASMPSATSRRHIDRAKVEPRVAEMLFNRMAEREPNLTVLPGHVPASVRRDGALITSATFRPVHGNGSVTVSAKVFADALYEGDLMALTGAENRIGREARSQYGEPHAGVLYTMERPKAKGQRGFPLDADQGRLNIRYNSHATAEIVEGPHSGEADGSVMAYNWRLILTRDPGNRVMVGKPGNYDIEMARRAASTSARPNFVPDLPNAKVAWNHRGRLIGPQNGYPGGDWPTRERIARQCLDAMLMALWYMQNEPEVREDIRQAFAGYGLAADEFIDNHYIPYEIYVREARRLVGRAVFTEHDNMIADGIARTPVHADSVAITDWPVDSVACLPRNVGGSHMDGVFFLAEICRPAQVPYRCLLPKEVDNLLVPVALSASHVGWGSIRLEPVWMQTGEAAGFAAAIAVKGNITPAGLDPDLLARTLAQNRCAVSFFNDADSATPEQWPAVQYFGTKGFFAGYDADHKGALTRPVAEIWATAFARMRQAGYGPAQTAAAVHAAEARQDAGPVTFSDFLTLLKHAHNSTNSTPLTRGEACRLMFKLIE